MEKENEEEEKEHEEVEKEQPIKFSRFRQS